MRGGVGYSEIKWDILGGSGGREGPLHAVLFGRAILATQGRYVACWRVSEYLSVMCDHSDMLLCGWLSCLLFLLASGFFA